MRKLLYLLVLLSIAAVPSRAQTPHSAVLTWNASSDAAANPSLTYNAYKFLGPCPIGTTIVATSQFTKINTTPITKLSYTDTNLSVGSNVCYYVTASLNGVESVPSASAGGTVPPAGVTTITVTVQ